MKMGKLAGALALVSTVGAVAATPAGAGVSAARIAGGVLRPDLARRRAGVRRRGRAVAARARRGRAGAGSLASCTRTCPPRPRARRPRNFKATIPVYFHVVTDGAIGALTTRRSRSDRGAQQHVRRAARAARRPASASSSPASPGPTTRLVLHQPRRRGRALMKQALKQGGDNALNLYSTTAGDYLGWAYLPDITEKPGQAYLDGVVVRLGVDPRHVDHLRGPLRPGRDRHARGRPLAEPRAHVLRRLQRQGRLRRRHPGREDADVGLPGGQGHLHQAGPGPDPQLHGLLLRLLLHGVHRGPGAAHARRLAAVPRELADASRGARPCGRRGVRCARVCRSVAR